MRQALPFQHHGSQFLSDNRKGYGHMLVADPGLGKTYMQLKAFREQGARRMLILCPPVLTTNWVREAEKDGVVAADLGRQKKLAGEAEMVSASIDNLRRHSEFINSQTWDVIALDEAQYAMNPEAKRTQYAYSYDCGKFTQLTATPTPRHAGQLWTHVNATAPARIDHMGYDAFVKRYCTTAMRRMHPDQRYPTQVITGNNRIAIPELRRRLRGWWMRIKKDDVLDQLPPLSLNAVYVPARRAEIKRIENEVDPETYEQFEFALQVALETGNHREFDAIDEGSFAKIRRLIGVIKAEYAADYAMTRMAAEPVILWAWHHDVMDVLERRMSSMGMRVARADGTMATPRKVAVVDALQNGELDAAICQIKAMGVGHTMTAAQRAIFVERSSVPDDNRQAGDRNRRIGSEIHEHIDHDVIVLQGTVDEAINAIINKRTKEWEELSE